MKKLIFLSFSIFLSSLTFGQQEVSNKKTQERDMNYFLAANSGERLYTFAPKVDDIEGSPYLMETPIMNGKLLTSDSLELSNMVFRYNMHDDRVEYKKDGKVVQLFPYRIRGFSFYDTEEQRKREFRNGFQNYLDNYTPVTYFEVLYDGEVKLLGKYEKQVIRIGSKINAPGINTHSATSQYSEIKRYYIQKGDEFTPIRLNKGDILRALSSSELKQHLKSTKNKCRTLADIVTAIKYYENL